jgi:hypothetical protein
MNVGTERLEEEFVLNVSAEGEPAGEEVVSKKRF